MWLRGWLLISYSSKWRRISFLSSTHRINTTGENQNFSFFLSIYQKMVINQCKKKALFSCTVWTNGLTLFYSLNFLAGVFCLFVCLLLFFSNIFWEVVVTRMLNEYFLSSSSIQCICFIIINLKVVLFFSHQQGEVIDKVMIIKEEHGPDAWIRKKLKA